MSRGFDLIRRRLAGRLPGAAGKEAPDTAPSKTAVPSAAAPRPAAPTASPPAPLLAKEPFPSLLRRQLPEILRPRRRTTPGPAVPPEQPPQASQPPPETRPKSAVAATEGPASLQSAPESALMLQMRATSPKLGAPAPPAPQDPYQIPPRPVQEEAPLTSVRAPVAPNAPARPAQPLDTATSAPGETRAPQRQLGARHGSTGEGTIRIDRSNARKARRHSIFVALMKGLLPGLVIGLAGVFVFYSIDFRPDILPDNVQFDPGKVSVGSDGVRMVAPKLSGVDDRQQTFEVTAEEAVQSRADPALVTLVGIDARINLTDGGTIGFSAQSGRFNTDLNQIWLSDNLEVRSSEGYVAQLAEAQVDFKNGLMVSNSPVLVYTDTGVINASGVRVLDGGEKIVFTGRVVLSLNGNAEATQ